MEIGLGLHEPRAGLMGIPNRKRKVGHRDAKAMEDGREEVAVNTP